MNLFLRNLFAIEASHPVLKLRIVTAANVLQGGRVELMEALVIGTTVLLVANILAVLFTNEEY